MGALAICPRTRAQARAAAREAAAAPAVRVVEPTKKNHGPAESPLVHENAAEALVLAFSSLEDDAASRRVVAYVLEDGTVVADGREAGRGRDWANGKVAGRNWTLWWERRALGAAR